MDPERSFPFDGQVEGVPTDPVRRQRSEIDARIAADWDELSRLQFDPEPAPDAGQADGAEAPDDGPAGVPDPTESRTIPGHGNQPT